MIAQLLLVLKVAAITMGTVRTPLLLLTMLTGAGNIMKKAVQRLEALMEMRMRLDRGMNVNQQEAQQKGHSLVELLEELQVS